MLTGYQLWSARNSWASRCETVWRETIATAIEFAVTPFAWRLPDETHKWSCRIALKNLLRHPTLALLSGRAPIL